MFYAHFVLSKKGPLARIWLAAHWDKKLTKAHVFETNVPSCVDSIIHPKVKLALRTSGHLLLGVVRIHSRKAKYLLADCNEAFVKIKMAFRPGVVDLPEENREAAFAAITLPEVFHDFDTSMPDFNDAEVQKQFTLNQSRVEDITMKEDLVNINLAQEDGFGDLGFDEREILRDAQSNNDSVYKRSSDESGMLADVSKQKDATIDTSLEKPMEIGLEEQFRNDGFGGDMGMGDGILGEEFMNAGGNLFEEQPEIQAPQIEPPDLHAGEVHLSQPEPSPEPDIPPEKDEKAEEAAAAAQQAVIAEAEKKAEQTVGETTTTTVTDQTTLVQNEDVEFALEPIVEAAGHKERQRRKRKLIVDDIKELAGDLIKSQLKDTSDIVTSLDLAPPTKKLMLWKETGGAEKLFSLPGRLHSSKRILVMFADNLQTDIPREPKRQRKEKVHEEPEIQREAEEIPIPDLSAISHLSTSNIHVEEPAPIQRPEDIPSTSHHQEDPTPAPPPVQDFSLMSTRRGSVSSSDGGYGDDDLWGGHEDDDDDIPSVRAPEIPQEEEEDPSNLFAEEEEDVAAEEGEDEEKHHERVLNKRAHSMLIGINKLLQTTESISFNEVTRKLYRKQVASKFYSLLVLKKQQAIDVYQDESFMDIRISRGPLIAEMI